MAQVSVPGVNGTPIVFTVTGTSATNLANSFANTLNPENKNHELTINVLSKGSTVPGAGSVTATAPLNVLNDILGAGAYSLSSSTLPGVIGQYTFIDTNPSGSSVTGGNSNVTVTGSAAGHDTVLAASSATYMAVGSDNVVSFTEGNDVYQGSTVSGASGDTVGAGAGSDTINTGVGNTTVFGGGTSLIALNDTTPSTGSGYNDVAYLGSGTDTVLANGADDLVFAASAGQLIVGSNTAADTASMLNVVIANPTNTATSASHDTIIAGSGTTNVYDSVGGATIFNGSGNLNFIGEAPMNPGMDTVSDTILSSTGTTAIFATSGDNIAFASDTSGSAILVSAGTGNETLNGANASGGVDFFADQDSTQAIADTVVGGNGFNYFQTGAGTEDYLGGTGTNIFDIATNLGANTHITIYDFASGNDSVNFAGINNINDPSQATMTTGTTSNGTPTLTVTFADKSSVEFIGISSLPPGHVI